MYPTPTRNRRVRQLPTRRSRRGVDGRMLAAGAAVLALAVLGVTVVLTSGRSAVRRGDCVIGIDLSPSVVQNEGLLDQYLGWAHDVLADCAEQDATRFAVFPITNITRTDVVVPVVATFDSDEGNPDNRRRRILEWVDSEAVTEVEGLVERVGPPQGGTDLLAATGVAEGHFRTSSDFKRLVLLTDGLNTAAPADIRSADLGPDGIEDIITALSDEGRLPSIDRVDVEMYGIGLGEVAQTVPDARVGEIEDLWRRYIEVSGGRLTAYQRTYSGG